MTNQFVKYVVNLFKDVPVYVYEVLGLVFIIGTVLMFALGGFKKGIRYSSRLLIAEYVVLLFSTTVIFRSYRRRLKYDFHPFWSYDALQNGGEKLLPEIIMNVVVFVPVGLIVAIMVKVRMPGGPVFFVQKRVGKGGKLFKCHKFRTMTVKHNGSTVSVAGDSRITPFGATLRHYKLDELPGLWDVLIGNMSFVGPRPDVPGYADQLQGDDRRVLKLRPGITGPATLKYRLEDEMISDYVRQKQKDGDTREMQVIAEEYNDKVIYPDKVRLNLYYLDHYSFVKDFQMLLCTVFGKKMKYADEVI